MRIAWKMFLHMQGTMGNNLNKRLPFFYYYSKLS